MQKNITKLSVKPNEDILYTSFEEAKQKAENFLDKFIIKTFGIEIKK